MSTPVCGPSHVVRFHTLGPHDAQLSRPVSRRVVPHSCRRIWSFERCCMVAAGVACCRQRHRKRCVESAASCAAAVTPELQVRTEKEQLSDVEGDPPISERATLPLDPQSAIAAHELRWQQALAHWETISKPRNKSMIMKSAGTGDEVAMFEQAALVELQRGAEAAAFGGAWCQALWVLNRASAWDVELELPVYKDVLRACWAARRPRPALLVLDELEMIENPDVETYDIVVSTILSSSWGMFVDRSYRHQNRAMVDPVVDEEMTEMVWEMWEYLEDGLLDDFEEVSGDLEAAKAEWEAAMVLSGRAKKSRTSREGHWELALANFDKMTELTLAQDARTYEALMTSCMHSARWQECLHLMEQASNLGLGAEKGLYRAAIWACENAQQPEPAISILEEARQRGIAADPITYEAAIRCCARTGRDAWISLLLNEAYEALRTILAEHTLHGQALHALPPNPCCESEGSKAVGALIGSCCIAGQWETALGLLESMPSLGFSPQARDFNAVIRECYMAGQGETAVCIFDKMRERRLLPNLMSFHVAMLQHVYTGCWTIAKDLYCEITKSGQSPPWIKSLMRIDVSELPGEIAELATCIFVEEVCRKQTRPKRGIGRDLVITTHKEDSGSAASFQADRDGMDSPLKRRLHRLLAEKYRLEVDSLSPGEITIPRKEFKKVLQSFHRFEAAPTKKRRQAIGTHVARHNLAYLPTSVRGDEDD